MELHGRSHAFCHSCAGKIARLETVPPTVAAIRQILDRERRTMERREGGNDRRIFPRERRVGERRSPHQADAAEGASAPFILPDFEDIVVEIEDAQIEAVELTSVRLAPES